MDEFKITKERILAAAAKCGTAKATLETLFPEAFEKKFIRADFFEIRKGGVLIGCGVNSRDDADMCLNNGWIIIDLGDDYYRFEKK